MLPRAGAGGQGVNLLKGVKDVMTSDWTWMRVSDKEKGMKLCVNVDGVVFIFFFLCICFEEDFKSLNVFSDADCLLPVGSYFHDAVNVAG